MWGGSHNARSVGDGVCVLVCWGVEAQPGIALHYCKAMMAALGNSEKKIKVILKQVQTCAANISCILARLDGEFFAP